MQRLWSIVVLHILAIVDC